MGKPIALTGRLPFSIDGIEITGAKINGEAILGKLYILKQRSAHTYDLIDESGKVYEYVQMVYRNKDSHIMNFDDSDESLVESLRDNTFFIKLKDEEADIEGFCTMYMIHKIKLHNGQYILRKKA